MWRLCQCQQSVVLLCVPLDVWRFGEGSGISQQEDGGMEGNAKHLKRQVGLMRDSPIALNRLFAPAQNRVAFGDVELWLNTFMRWWFSVTTLINGRDCDVVNVCWQSGLDCCPFKTKGRERLWPSDRIPCLARADTKRYECWCYTLRDIDMSMSVGTTTEAQLANIPLLE